MWTLILLLRFASAPAVTQIEFANEDACKAAMKSASQMEHYEEARCFNKFSGQSIKQ